VDNAQAFADAVASDRMFVACRDDVGGYTGDIGYHAADDIIVARVERHPITLASGATRMDLDGDLCEFMARAIDEFYRRRRGERARRI
jgi:hypothetical protein